MTSDTISAIRSSFSSINPSGKFNFKPLMFKSIVTEFHPALLKVIWGHAKTIVGYADYASVLGGHIDINFCCSCVPSIGYQFRQRVFGISDNVPQAPNEIIIFK